MIDASANALIRDLAFYASPPHECSYLPDRRAVTLFVDPYTPMSTELYTDLAHQGFRRSGRFVYRPECRGCSACKSVRIPVDAFQPDRSQRRTFRRNADLEVRLEPAEYRQEHFELYRRYMQARHEGGGMDVDQPEQYRQFLLGGWSETRFVEFREGPRLLGVAVVDRMRDGLSAVYTFFDPSERTRGLGTYAVLWQIEHARREGLGYVYLGYWIAESPKMSYKRRFRPLERLEDGNWRRLGE